LTLSERALIAAETRARRRETMRICAGVLSVPAPSVAMTYYGGWLHKTFVQRLDVHLAISLLPDHQRVAVIGRLCWPRVPWEQIGRAIGTDARGAREAWAAGIDTVRERILYDDDRLETAEWPAEMPDWMRLLMLV